MPWLVFSENKTFKSEAMLISLADRKVLAAM